MVRREESDRWIEVNKKLALLENEKAELASKLILANRQLEFQNEEKEKRASELIYAQKELTFQNREKEKRAQELVIANKELNFQNKQKNERAAELVIANIELIFQNEEKEKRASEVVLAKKELENQNLEKVKRSAELIASNKEVDELEKRVKERTEDLESFSYSVSHDLRTPLRAISGYANMLEEDYSSVLDDEGKRLLGEVKNNAKRMGVLIDDLLTFSRLGRKRITKTSVDINTLIDTVILDISHSSKHNAIIKYNNLLPASADYQLLQHVFLNLISNAIKYSSKTVNPMIEIKSELKKNELVYSISDNGAGFDMKYVNKLFGVFQRLHSDVEFSGTGVGLALVKRIINKHDGKVWAKGKEGVGATFFFSLPDVDLSEI